MKIVDGRLKGIFQKTPKLEEALISYFKKHPQLSLSEAEHGITLLQPSGSFSINFLKDEIYLRKPVGKNELLFKALGLQNEVLELVDNSAGLLRDSIFCLRSSFFRHLKIKAFERNPVLFILLNDAIANALPEFPDLSRVQLKWGSVQQNDIVSGLQTVIYFDPMFNDEGSSALPKKPMQVLRTLNDADTDASTEFLRLRHLGAKHIVVKRSDKGLPLAADLIHSYQGKMVRYDRYNSLPTAMRG